MATKEGQAPTQQASPAGNIAKEVAVGLLGSLFDMVRQRLEAKPERRELSAEHLAKIHAQRIDSSRKRGHEALSQAIKMNVRDLENRGQKISAEDYRAKVGLDKSAK